MHPAMLRLSCQAKRLPDAVRLDAREAAARPSSSATQSAIRGAARAISDQKQT